MSDGAIILSSGPFAWQVDDWQRLWISTQTSKRRWRSLAILPAGPGATPEDILEVAVALARTGMEHVGAPIHVADATRVTLAQLEPFSAILESHLEEGTVLIALSALGDNVTSLPLAKVADAALLCIFMGATTEMEARKTISQLGAPHFIGSALFRGQEQAARRR